MKALLDTHILLWWLEDADRLSAEQSEVLSQANPDHPLLISDITLWEIATLYRLGRIRLDLPLREWLESACAPPLVSRCPITPAVAAEVASLADTVPRDPADRIIIATSRVFGATLLTADQRIIDAKVVPTLT